MTEIPEKLAEILEDFRWITDRNERAEMLIEYGDQFETVPPSIAERPYPEDHRVQACESEAYVWVEPLPDGTAKFHYAVENPQGLSAKALAAILDQTLSGVPLEQVLEVQPDIVFDLFGKDLSMGKGAGLTSMVSLTKAFARQQMQNSK
jgi:cysteine desulfuration protein SufE